VSASAAAVDLACPECGGSLEHDDAALHCSACDAVYPFVEGVPVLLAEALSEQHRHQRAYFDAEFSAYGEYRLENWRLSFIERIFGAVNVLDGGEPYLDVGVGGSGATVIEAARRRIDAVGCDLSVAGVAAARRFAVEQGVDDHARFVVCAAETLPFPDSTFGSASAVALLEHLEDDRPAVAELARVLRPGARVWLTVPHAFRYIPPPVWPLYWWHDRRIGHKRHYDEQRLRELCADLGLRHVGTYFSGHPIKFVQFALSLALPPVRRTGSPLWWRLELRDRARSGRKFGALQLNAVFERR
jgi:SAM-dependent methyltransferase